MPGESLVVMICFGFSIKTWALSAGRSSRESQPSSTSVRVCGSYLPLTLMRAPRPRDWVGRAVGSGGTAAIAACLFWRRLSMRVAISDNVGLLYEQIKNDLRHSATD